MPPPPTPVEASLAKPIHIGLTCWRWQTRRAQLIVQLAERMGVTVQLRQRIHGLHCEIEAEVSGRNVDRFLGEFVRHC